MSTSRPARREAQIGAWASPQSEPLPDRAALDARVEEAERTVLRRASSRARPFWGGYALRPEQIEFWQGQAARLHDRFLYTREDGGWRLERLAP